MKDETRKPDWRVSTPSQLDPDRWIAVGAAWNIRADTGTPYISVQLDVMPVTGRLSLFPWSQEKSGKKKP